MSVARRTFASSGSVSKDLVQDLYIKELKAYKAPPVAKDAHVGVTKEFSAPKAPTTPALPADLSAELAAYETSEPTLAEVQHATSTAGAHDDADGSGAGPKEFLAFLEADLPKEEAHH